MLRNHAMNLNGSMGEGVLKVKEWPHGGSASAIAMCANTKNRPESRVNNDH